MTLFTTGTDPSKAQWDGASTSHSDVCNIFSADDARHIDHFPSHLRAALFNYSNIYVDMPPSRTRRGYKSASAKNLLKYLSLGLGSDEGGAKEAFSETESIIEGINKARRKALAPEISRLRAIKSEREQGVMRAAADISGRAHAKVYLVWNYLRVPDSSNLIDNALYTAWYFRVCIGGPFRVYLLTEWFAKIGIRACRCFRVSFCSSVFLQSPTTWPDPIP